MGGSVVQHLTFRFSDADSAGGGHVIDLLSALASGQADALCINSDTTVSTPTGFSGPAPTFVGGQGWYVFRRQDSGGQTVTIKTAGNFETIVIAVRLGDIVAADQANSSVVDASAGTSAPSVSTGTLAENHEIVVVSAGLHSFPGSAPSTPVWGGGAVAVDSNVGTGVAHFVGVITDTGTDSSESPTLSWTNAANDRYFGILTYTTAATTDVSGSDSGALSDSGAVTAAVAGSDTGTGADSGAVAASVAGADTATLADAGAVAVAAAGADTGAFADAGAAAVAAAGSDIGAATDSGAVAAAIAGSDAGTLTESSVLVKSSNTPVGPPTVSGRYLRDPAAAYLRSGTIVYSR